MGQSYRLGQRVLVHELERHGAIVSISHSMGIPMYRVRADDGSEINCMGYHILPAITRPPLRLIAINGECIA